MLETTKDTSPYAEQFTRLAPHLGELGAFALPSLRHEAIARFRALGFPTTRDEEWKYTSVAEISRTAFSPAPRHSAVAPAELDRLVGFATACRLVFVDGRHDPALSATHGLPANVLVSSLNGAKGRAAELIGDHLGRYAQIENQAFVALNSALAADGAVVFIPRGTVVEEPIHLVFLTTEHGAATISSVRALIVAGENSQATVVETYVGATGHPSLTNSVVEVIVGESAVLDHVKVEEEAAATYHVANTQLHVGRAASFTSHNISFGGKLVRNDIGAVLDGEGIECTVNGLYVATGRQHIDNHTGIDHAKPHCNSHELYKGIMDGHATGVFNGKIFVRQDAQKTDAKQTNQNLLLSADAVIDTKPQLEIYADDVRCTHGATVGQLSDEAIFYLRSRGIGAAEARAMLTHAFASDVLDRIKLDAVRERLETRLYQILR